MPDKPKAAKLPASFAPLRDLLLMVARREAGEPINHAGLALLIIDVQGIEVEDPDGPDADDRRSGLGYDPYAARAYQAETHTDPVVSSARLPGEPGYVSPDPAPAVDG